MQFTRFFSFRPDGCQMSPVIVVWAEVGNEREVRDLSGRPAKLKYYYEGRVVHYLSPFSTIFTLDAGQEYERKTSQHAKCS
jgi:hypothetical protein